jgi:hypothetical protein
MARSERDLFSGALRRLRCPQCGGEIERDRCMCDWCGAVLSLTSRGDALRLEGVVCFACGHGNPGSERQRACGRCGQPFAATCPDCSAPVPLAGRCCGRCGLSVEDFNAERARLEVAAHQERRECERVLFAVFRWQVAVGIALMGLGLIVGRSDSGLRRPLVGVGAGAGALGALPLGLAHLAARRFRRWEP